jgi:predicted hotdog family 3-hydroxylacyl-ACP dehydratase
MDFPLSAEGLIPQKKPIVLVDRLLESDEEKSVSDFLIRNDGVFVEGGRIVSAGLMENIAQTCALRIGYVNRGQQVRIGVVGAVKNFVVCRFPAVGETLTTTVKEVLYVEPALVVSAETRVGNEVVATCEMKVFLTDHEG